MKKFLPSLFLLLFFCLPCFAQFPYSGVVSSSRTPPAGWGTAGLPATMPNSGGTTPNPWTPPDSSWPNCTTAQAGTTIPIPSGTSVTTINSAIAACAVANPTGSVILLATGTAASPASYTVASTQLRLADTSGGLSHNNTVLRGGGAQFTKITITGSGFIVYGNAWSANSATWTAGFAQGATSLTMAAPSSGSVFTTGQIIELEQCQTGFSGANCATGAISDNGGVFLCGGSTACNVDGAAENTLQAQTVVVTSITGTGPYTVNFSPALAMPNWSATGGGSTVNWTVAGSGGGFVNSPSGIGLEDVTVDETALNAAGNNVGIFQTNAKACWMKGVRVVGSGAAESLNFGHTSHCVVFNSYFDDYSYARADLSLSIAQGDDSDDLVLNTILLHGLSWEGTGSNQGDVIAYPDIEQTHTLYYEANPFQHHPGSSYTLYEGLETGHITDDDTFGTANFNSFVRNFMSGVDGPYLLSTTCASLSCVAMKVDGVHRFTNIIGNAIGSSLITNYQAILSTPTNGITDNAAYRWSADINDPLVLSTSLRWSNCDTATATCRNVSSEIPTTLTGNAVPYESTVPSNNNVPCSFFLPGMTTSCTPLLSGGTGLSWWKVQTGCTFTSGFSCTSSQIQPFPIAGPELSGGPYVNGHAYDNPAYVAFHTLPIDTIYQCQTGGAVCTNNLAITGSIWSGSCSNQAGGTYACETLTVTGFPSGSNHIMGGFQITGASGCNTSGAPGGSNEFNMTGSSLSGTTATIIYALASSPGSCVGGTMLWPDVKQFDEGVFESDPGGGTVATPTFSPGAGSYSSSQTVTISTSTGGATLCYTTDGSTPTEVANACSGGTTQTYTTPITVSTSETVKALGTLSGQTDSSIGSATYVITSTVRPAPATNMMVKSISQQFSNLSFIQGF